MESSSNGGTTANMELRIVKDDPPQEHKTVFIISSDKKSIVESWIIKWGDQEYWTDRGPVSYGGKCGYTFEEYPYWVSKDDVLKEIFKNSQ